MSTTPAHPTGRAKLQPGSHAGIDPHPVVFTGSGAEYFRVWIVNVLLSIVTLSLYTPWARRRTAQYFYSHTQVVGSPLEFVASQRRMVFGFLGFVVLYLAYKLAQSTGQDLAAALMFFGFAALLPYLWASAQRFRMGATRWRGIRLAFTASWKEVYLASWPVFAIAAIWTALVFIGLALAPDTPQRVLRGRAAVPGWPVLALGVVTVVLTLLCVIRLEYNYKRLFVARARIGGQSGRWKPVYADFVKVWLATAGIFLLVVLAIALLSGVIAATWWVVMRQWMGGTNIVGMILAVVLAALSALLLLVLATLPARAYREARMFQLVWNNIGFGQIARTKTDLRTGAYVWLRIKNALLSLLTLGFYRPFAVASEYAAKTGSVTIHLKGGAEQLEGELVRQQGAFGDAAADAIGLDLI